MGEGGRREGRVRKEEGEGGGGGGGEVGMKFLQGKSLPYSFTSSAVVSSQVAGRSLHPCFHQADP